MDRDRRRCASRPPRGPRLARDLVAGSDLTFTDRGEYELKGVPDRAARGGRARCRRRGDRARSPKLGSVDVIAASSRSGGETLRGRREGRSATHSRVNSGLHPASDETSARTSESVEMRVRHRIRVRVRSGPPLLLGIGDRGPETPHLVLVVPRRRPVPNRLRGRRRGRHGQRHVWGSVWTKSRGPVLVRSLVGMLGVVLLKWMRIVENSGWGDPACEAAFVSATVTG